MEASEETLIERLNERAHDPERATDEGHGFRDSRGRPVIFVAAPPPTSEQLEAAEERLGFPLPALLRRVYLEVGNGGFGPGYGLLGLPTSQAAADQSSVGKYTALRLLPSKPPWPEKLIPLCEWGCGIASYLDCSRPGVPVVRLDPNMQKSDVAERVPLGMRFDGANQVAAACLGGGRLFWGMAERLGGRQAPVLPGVRRGGRGCRRGCRGRRERRGGRLAECAAATKNSANPSGSRCIGLRFYEREYSISQKRRTVKRASTRPTLLSCVFRAPGSAQGPF